MEFFSNLSVLEWFIFIPAAIVCAILAYCALGMTIVVVGWHLCTNERFQKFTFIAIALAAIGGMTYLITTNT